jgi:hypothetical protein
VRPSEAEAVLRQRLGSPNAEEQVSIRGLIEESIAFFRERPAVGVTEKFGDMLLFQFGIYDWGSGPLFEIDLVRQFSEVESGDEDAKMSQLHITRFYSPVRDLEALGADERWCSDHSDLPEFSQWVMALPALAAVVDMMPVKTVIRWELV